MEGNTTALVKSEGSYGHLGKSSNVPMEKCLIAHQMLELPEQMNEDLSVFMSVMSADTWSNVLSESHRKHLMKFLPTFPENDKGEKSETLRQLFNGDNFKYGSPLKEFHKKLKGGRFSPDIAKYISLCRKAKQREYKCQQHVYYTNLLKEILINRQRILQAASLLPPDEPILFEHFQLTDKTHKPKGIESRVKRRCAQMLSEINKECGIDDSSSSDDDIGESAMISRSRRQLFKVLRPGSPDNMDSGILGTFDPPPPPPVMSNGIGGNGTISQPKRSLSPVEMTENDLTEMLKKYKRRREKEPHHPELYIAGLSVDDIIMRVQAVKKFGRVVQRKKIRDRPQKRTPKMEVKTEVPVSQEDEEIDVSSTFDVVPDQSVMDVLPSMEKEPNPEEWAQNSALPQMGAVECSPTRANFFSLIRDIIHEDPEQKVTTLRVEERVQEWQEMDGVMENPWFLDQSNWVEQVASALKFLSGDVLGLSLENFVPLLDFKERAQHWKWIGMGRDSDAELEPLYHHWVQHKDDLSLDASIKPCSSPPPPRSRTDFTVRPTTDEEKAFFREQERERFSNPHKAFTYRLHGYEAVVGPVKGVYHKESAMNKAREHTILVNDRPAYVTILTLVRDAAARLPNGEGTRSDICELLKDSQFLAPGVPDSQINTVVSGALDRLHYEKDPCVKYDVNRKLWIYLHRNRTQQEFERIHLAQGAAVKAKKALQKPKPAKKCKEAASSQPISMISPTATMVTTTLPSQKLSSLAAVNSDSKLVNVDSVTPAALTQSSVPVTKVTFTPSSPMAVPPSPLGTPQSSPRVIVSSPLVHGTPQQQSVSKLITAGIRQVTPQVTQVIPPPQTISVTGGLGAGEREGSTVTEPLTLTSFAGHTGSLSTPLGIQSPVTSGQQVNKLSGQNIVVGQPIAGQSMLPGQRPITLSLLQSQGGTKLESVTLAPGQTGKPRTVLLQTQGGKGPKILTHQVLRSGATSQGVQVSASPVRMAAVTTSSQLTNLQAAVSASQTGQLPISSSTQTLAAALARAGVVHTGATTLTKVGGSMVAGTSKPLLTRMVSGGQPQIVTLSSLWASQANQQQKATEPKQMLKLQGGVIQSVSSAATTSSNIGTIINQSSTAATTIQGNVSAATKLQQVTVTRGGKPPTMVIGKLAGAGGRSLTSTTQTVAQIIQSGALVGKSAIVGGKPIIIGGKSLSFGGKPVQIGGKPVQLVGKGAHIGIVQSPGVASTVNVTQGSNIDTQASALVTHATAVTQAVSTAVSTKVSIDSPASSVVTMMTKSSHGSPMVSQLLKSAQQHAHNKPTQYVTLPQGSEAQTKVTGQLQGQQIKIAGGQQQVVTLSGSGQKIVTLAQGASGLTQVQQIGVSKSVVGGTSKSIMIPAGAILQGNHFMLQQANLPSTSKVITPQQLLSGGGSRPTLITTGGIKGLQNIQLVKTVISQPGGKPGQTTILLAQPSSQSAASVTTDTKVTQAGGVKAKTPPVYARIITPPPGVRLAAVRPGQVLAGIQVAPVQGLNIATSQANVTNIQSAVASMPQVITQAASGTQDNSQSQITVEQAAAEKSISESNIS